MDAVHWWALAGLVWMVSGAWAMVRAQDKAQQAAADRCLLRQQLEMMREAIELSEYGAQDEALDMIDKAARLKPQWDARQV